MKIFNRTRKKPRHLFSETDLGIKQGHFGNFAGRSVLPCHLAVPLLLLGQQLQRSKREKKKSTSNATE